MKKIYIMFASLTAFAFTACTDSKDDHPVLFPNPSEEAIRSDFLNTPANTAAPIEITTDNNTESIHMTCEQPDYGYQATVRYDVEVSFDEQFSTPAVETAPASIVLPSSFFNSKEINPTYEEIAQSICKLLDVQTDAQIPTPAQPLYVRLQANIQNASGDLVPNTAYLSNTVKFDEVVCSYLAIVVPGIQTGIFVRGDMNGWGAEPQWEFLM